MPGAIPSNPKLYYITHLNNLLSIATSDYIFSDARRLAGELNVTNIGMNSVKDRRLSRCYVDCHPGTTVGQFVPFYFCSRSVMLYIIHKANHLDLTYRGGQQPIVHLQIDMHRAIQWSEDNRQRWAFTDMNAALGLASFYKDLRYLDQLDWDAITALDWRGSTIQDHKQAEFLIYDAVSWGLVEKIGVFDSSRRNEVAKLLAEANYIPEIAIERSWYY